VALWTPPPESEEDDYVEPTTKVMTASPEWTESAKLFWKAMGEPDLAPGGPAVGTPQRKAYVAERQKKFPLTDKQIADWATSEVASFTWHVPTTISYGQKVLSANDPKLAAAFLNLINMYEHSDGGAYEFARAVGYLATDPTTYAGLGVGSVVARGAALAAAKAGFKKLATQYAITAGTAGAAEGGALMAGFDLTKQNIEQEAGAREDIDPWQTAKMTLAGMGFGTALGGTAGGLIGRHADKLAAAARVENDARMAALIQRQAGDLGDADSGDIGFGRQQVESGILDNLDDLIEVPDELMVPDAVLTHSPEERFPVFMRQLEEIDVNFEHTADGEVLANKSSMTPEQVMQWHMIAEGAGVKLKPGRNQDFFKIDGSPKQIMGFIEEATGFEFNRGKPKPKPKVDMNGPGTLKMSQTIQGFGPEEEADMLLDVIITLSEDAQKQLDSGIQPITRPVKPSEVYALQRGLTPEKMKALQEGSTKYSFPPLKGLPENKPLLYKKDGELIILNGTHRFHRAALKGDDPIDAYIFEDPAGIDGEPVAVPRPKNITDDEYIKILEDLQAEFLAQGEAWTLAQLSGMDELPAPNIFDIRTGKPIPIHESEDLFRRLAEMDELFLNKMRFKEPGKPGTTVVDEAGEKWELLARTKNGWYKAVNLETNEEKHLRRNWFEPEQTQTPSRSGTNSLSIYDADTARIIKMADDVTQSRPKEHIPMTHEESQSMADELERLGINIEAKNITDHWMPGEMLYLKNTYEAQVKDLGKFAISLSNKKKNGTKLTDEEMAQFNMGHTKVMTTRDLLRGVARNAARILNVLQAKPMGGVQDFNKGLLEAISIPGGRVNTERNINTIAEAAMLGPKILTQASDKMANERAGTWLLNIRYNMMLASWRTHFRNLTGNTAPLVYEHLMVSPVRMAISNTMYGARYAAQFIPGFKAPDPADWLTFNSWKSEFAGHMAAAKGSLRLAKEIAMGRDIGEGKVWNELGLRYNVVNVPNSAFGKIGTTPVRLLEAGDALFKNQHHNSKLYSLAEERARRDAYEFYPDRADAKARETMYKERYEHWIDNPTDAMHKEAKEYAAKLTYTNDPMVYGTILGGLARMAQTAQSTSLAFNFLIPFVRTPANLIGYAIDMTGVGHLPFMGKSKEILLRGTPHERADLTARLTVAAGLWAMVIDYYQEGKITGAGPQNWEEKKAWEEAGWQQSSVRIGDLWVGAGDVEPAGTALNIMASVMDYMALADMEDDGLAIFGTGLLTIADIIKDDSYLSTITDFIVAIDAKQEARSRSAIASGITSFLVPNLLRDFRRVTDPQKRQMAGENIWGQALRIIQNAVPGLSENLPPALDWKGDPMFYYGNAYERGLIPFNVKDATKQDVASAAIAYARIPIGTPDRRLSMPGRGNFIDLMSMDEGKGFVYSKYQEILGKARHEAINQVMQDSKWMDLVVDGEIGPGSNGDTILRQALAIGSKVGRVRMLQFLIENDAVTRLNGETIKINHPFDKQEYRDYVIAVQRDNIKVPREDVPQYDIRTPREGPKFFEP
jgi:hypothetical protein